METLNMANDVETALRLEAEIQKWRIGADNMARLYEGAKGELTAANARIAELEAQLAEARRTSEYWKAERSALIADTEKAEAQLAEANADWKKKNKHVIDLMAEVNHMRHRAEKAEADAESLRGALEQYADKKNWAVSNRLLGFLDQWMGSSNGSDIAQAALSPAAEGGSK